MSLPVIPYRAFCILVGEELSRDADRHLAEVGVTAVVLCADAAGQRCELLAVGDGRACKHIEAAHQHAPEGLSPFCAVRVEDKLLADSQAGADKELRRREARLVERERAVAELERKNAELAARAAAALRAFRRK